MNYIDREKVEEFLTGEDAHKMMAVVRVTSGPTGLEWMWDNRDLALSNK